MLITLPGQVRCYGRSVVSCVLMGVAKNEVGPNSHQHEEGTRRCRSMQTIPQCAQSTADTTCPEVLLQPQSSLTSRNSDRKGSKRSLLTASRFLPSGSWKAMAAEGRLALAVYVKEQLYHREPTLVRSLSDVLCAAIKDSAWHRT